jgi:hypothetical protein
VERCVEASPEHGLPASVRPLEFLEDEQTGVVDYRVDPAERLEGALDRPPASALVSKVVVGGNRRAPGARDLGDDRVGNRRIAAAAVELEAGVVHDDVGAPHREGARVRRAQPPAGAGDQHRPAVEAEQRRRSGVVIELVTRRHGEDGRRVTLRPLREVAARPSTALGSRGLAAARHASGALS